MKIGILGLGKLGEYYIRDLYYLGAKIVTSKNSTFKSTVKKNNLIKLKYNIDIHPAKNFIDFFNQKIDTVLICSPNKFHEIHLKKTIKENKNIIVEKPIISIDRNLSKIKNLNKINNIIHYNKKIFYSLINEYYAKQYLRLLKNIKLKKKKFFFEFYTQGKHKKQEIMNDLLPHLFSVLDNLINYNKIHKIQKKISNNKNLINFFVDNCSCEVIFVENSKIKKLSFGIDDYIVERITNNKNGKINTFLNCKKLKKKIKIKNPLTENIKKIFKLNKNFNRNNEYQKIKDNYLKCCQIFYA